MVHIGVQGQEDQNSFTLTVWDNGIFTTTEDDDSAIEGSPLQYDVSSQLSPGASSLT